MITKIIIGAIFIVFVVILFSILIYRVVKKRNELKKHLFIIQKMFKFIIFMQPKIESKMDMVNLYLENFDKIFDKIYVPFFQEWSHNNGYTDKYVPNIKKDVSIRIVDHQEVIQDGVKTPVWGVYFFSNSTICIAPIDKTTNELIEESEFHNLIFHEISHVVMKYYTGDSDATHKSDLFRLEQARENDIKNFLLTLNNEDK